MTWPGIHCHWHNNEKNGNVIPAVYHICILQWSSPLKGTCTK